MLSFEQPTKKFNIRDRRNFMTFKNIYCYNPPYTFTWRLENKNQFYLVK